jgi:hypothetical protein
MIGGYVFHVLLAWIFPVKDATAYEEYEWSQEQGIAIIPGVNFESNELETKGSHDKVDV